ncbi:glucose-1-phosphate thymidylyltransferase [Candidatus Woesearchaeota archaeon]|nr:glucose-1-phosphate thymidylyltransferase [Candidatus Woesearchaeota archaeon]
MKGLILAGGHGLRLRPITHTIQKQLIPVANKPIIYYAIEDLVRAGIVDIGIIIGPNKEQVKDVVGDGTRWNCRISYIEQDAPKGLAHAVWTAKEFIDKSDFVMYLGDNLLRGGIDNFVSNFALTKPAASIMLTPVPDPQRFGVAKLDENGNVSQLLEKPKNPPSNLAIVGIYAFTQQIFEAIKHITPSARGELEITDAMQWLLSNGHRVTKELVNGWWKDTGEAEALLHANQLMLDDAVTKIEGAVEEGAKVSGRVLIGKDTVVKASAVVRGPAVIGEKCVIGEGVFIGPNTAIGDCCTIERSEIEHAIILRNCSLLNAGRITDSIIGQNSVIKAGTKRVPAATTLVLGDNSSVELP